MNNEHRSHPLCICFIVVLLCVDAALARENMIQQAPDVGRSASESIKLLGYTLDVEGLKQALSAKNIFTTMYASRVIAERDMRALIPVLEQHLDSHYKGYPKEIPDDIRDTVRIAVATALLRMHTDRADATEFLTHVVRHQNDLSNAIQAAKILAENGNPVGLPRLKNVLLNQKTPSFDRVQAARAMSAFEHVPHGTMDPKAVLWKSIRQDGRTLDKNEMSKSDRRGMFSVIHHSLASLAELGDAETLSKLTHYNAPDPHVRKLVKHAVKWLGKQLQKEKR